jgi:hypothetical protein
MHKSSSCELQSTKWLAGNTADRPSFAVTIGGTFTGPRPFQVFALPTGLLFLELRNKPGAGGDGQKLVMAGAIAGGLIGGLIAAGIASSMSGTPDRETGFDLCDEDQLFELARTRKRSFVAKLDEIRSVSIDAPGSFGRIFADRSLVGWITLRDSTLGKVTMRIRDPLAMAVAIDALPRRLGDRIHVNVELDDRTTRFVPKRA